MTCLTNYHLQSCFSATSTLVVTFTQPTDMANAIGYQFSLHSLTANASNKFSKYKHRKEKSTINFDFGNLGSYNTLCTMQEL